MQAFSITPIVEREASEQGALDGFEATCSCGLVLRSSLRSLLETDVADHAAYHARQAAERERRAMAELPLGLRMGGSQ